MQLNEKNQIVICFKKGIVSILLRHLAEDTFQSAVSKTDSIEAIQVFCRRNGMERIADLVKNGKFDEAAQAMKARM